MSWIRGLLGAASKGKGIKGAGKGSAVIRKNQNVSTPTIPNGQITGKAFGDPSEPGKIKIEVISKDGKQKVNVKARDIRLKGRPETEVNIPPRQEPTRPRSEAQQQLTIEDFEPEDLLQLSKQRVARMVINDSRFKTDVDTRLTSEGLTGNAALQKYYGGDGEINKFIRSSVYGKGGAKGLRKNTKEISQAKKTKTDAKKLETITKQNDDLVARNREIKEKGKDAYENRHKTRPSPDDPEFQGNRAKFMKAFQKHQDTGRWNLGGSVNVNGAEKYQTITNRFSDRMLPNKKRTTRIY